MTILFRSFVLVWLLALVGAVGCSSDDAKASCGVVVDATGFADVAKAKELLSQNLPEFLGGCGWVAYAAITGASVGSSCQHRPLTLVTGHDNPSIEEKIRTQLLTKAGERAHDLLGCRDGSKGSDVLGGLQVIADRLGAAPAGTGVHRVAVFSDLMNNKGVDFKSCDFADPETRSALVERLKGGGLIPDLGGATVTVYGFNLLEERRPECVPPLRELWKAIFTEAGTGDLQIV